MRKAPHLLRLIFIQAILAFLLLLPLPLSGKVSEDVASHPYVEPSLSVDTTENKSVIVTGEDVQTAAAAVTQAGGQIESELWLIDAVSATLSGAQLDQVSTHPGILSVVENKQVQTGAAFSHTFELESWATDRRHQVFSHYLEDPLKAPILLLPDEGVFAVNDHGQAVIMNEDGSLRHSLNLNQSHFHQSAVTSETGIVYAASHEKVNAIDSVSGSIIWSVNAPDKFSGGVALAADRLIVTDEDEEVYALDLNNGSQLWTYTQAGSPGKFLAPPAVGADGIVYVLSEKGYLTALNPDNGQEIWTYQAAESAAPYTQALQFDSEGNMYFFGDKGHVYQVDANGQVQYQVDLNDEIKAQIVIAVDEGTLFAGTKEGKVVRVNGDGVIAFEQSVPSAETVYLATSLTADGQTLFAATKEGEVLAYHTETGQLQWLYEAHEEIKGSPLLVPGGNLHVGTKEGRYKIIDAATGFVLYAYDGFDDFRNGLTISENGLVFFHDSREDEIVVLSPFPVGWHGQLPSVETTADPAVYKVANPLPVDLGADVAHENGVTGAGVTVAVIDSGVYFDANVPTTLGTAVQNHFLGQADFVGSLNCADTGAYNDGGTPSTCFSDYTSSYDGFGHGSHVAGIIWNNAQDYYSGVKLGIAPDANILSIRVLDDMGIGTYVDLIEGIQYVVAHANTFNIRVVNLSLSGLATTPYFVDPVNRAVEAAWANGIVVMAAAGNSGAAAETITVPGNDPYVITVGSLNSQNTPGYWGDDTLSSWSSTGPTLDGFIKPDILVPGTNIVSYMHNDPITPTNSAYLVQVHPDYATDTSLFRLSGTSMSTAVASGAAALLLDAYPSLTPDQVKFHLLYTARTAQTNGELVYSPLRQGLGRIWMPDILFDPAIPTESANADMDLAQDLAHSWATGDDPDPANNPDLAYHYEGPVQRLLSDDGTILLYYVEDVNNGNLIALGASTVSDGQWIDDEALFALDPTFHDGQTSWSSGGYLWSGGGYLWSGGGYLWSGGGYLWSGGGYLWSGGGYLWSGGGYLWSGNYIWAGSSDWQAGIDVNSVEVNANNLAKPGESDTITPIK